MQTCGVSLKTSYSYSIVLLIMPGDSWLLVVYVWWVLPDKLSDTQFHPIPRSVLQMLRCNFLNRPNVPTETHPEPSARAMHCSAVAVFLSTLTLQTSITLRRFADCGQTQRSPTAMKQCDNVVRRKNLIWSESPGINNQSTGEQLRNVRHELAIH